MLEENPSTSAIASTTRLIAAATEMTPALSLACPMNTMMAVIVPGPTTIGKAIG